MKDQRAQSGFSSSIEASLIHGRSGRPVPSGRVAEGAALRVADEQRCRTLYGLKRPGKSSAEKYNSVQCHGVQPIQPLTCCDALWPVALGPDETHEHSSAALPECRVPVYRTTRFAQQPNRVVRWARSSAPITATGHGEPRA